MGLLKLILKGKLKINQIAETIHNAVDPAGRPKVIPHPELTKRLKRGTIRGNKKANPSCTIT
jgi:hypothetical protein